MADFDAEMIAEQAVLIGLLSRAQVREAKDEAEDGTMAALTRVLTRKGLLTSWQVERLSKGDVKGFHYGGCRVLFHLAEGTFARVYRGEKMPGRQPVAIKVLRQRFASDSGAVATFGQEAEHGLRLVHPNIVRILEYGQEEDRHFMIMEYVEGSNLRDFLKIRQRLDAKDALPLMMGLARGLQYANQQGVAHRDIKGTNILVSNSGVAKLVDFGLAEMQDDFSSDAPAAAAATVHSQRTVDYSALERTCGSPKGDPRSDIYFLGCVFYQMLTGNLALPEVETDDPLAKMLKRSFGAIKPLSEHRLAPDAELTRIVEKMMKMDLRSRYQTMDEVVADLEAYESHMADPSKGGAKTMGPKRSEEDAFFESLFRRGGAAAEPAAVAPPEPPTLLCVEAQEPIREAFRKTFAKMGYKVLLVGDARTAVERFGETRPAAVVFDADGLGAETLDAFKDMHARAHDDGQELAAVVLLGPRQHDLALLLPGDDRLVVLNKPIKMKDVQEALQSLVPVG